MKHIHSKNIFKLLFASFLYPIKSALRLSAKARASRSLLFIGEDERESSNNVAMLICLGIFIIFLVTDNKAYAVEDCVTDGQINCRTTDAFKAGQANGIVATNIVAGSSVGGVAGAIANCSADGVVGCIATATFKSAAISSAIPANIKSGATIAGVAGTLATAACASDGQIGCVVDGTSFKSAMVANVIAGNIKRGVAIGAVTGVFPSSSSALPRFSDSGGTANTSAPSGITTSLTNFVSQMTSAGSFEFWDSNGQRYTGSGDTDITSANIGNGVVFENLGITGTAATVAPSAWDIRAGVTVGSTAGKLKTNCRNGGNLALYDIQMPKAFTINDTTDTLNIPAHGFSTQDPIQLVFEIWGHNLGRFTTYYTIVADANNIKVATSAANALASTAIDIVGNVGSQLSVYRWQDGVLGSTDTIDDANNGGAPLTAHPWSSSNNFCTGVESVAGDANVWKDVTTGGCDATKCRYQDKITQLTWSKLQSTSITWERAVELCNNLTLDGVTGWRLPTQRELTDAYEHGIYSAANANWISSANMGLFWSSTTFSYDTSKASALYVDKGGYYPLGQFKKNLFYATCVK